MSHELHASFVVLSLVTLQCYFIFQTSQRAFSRSSTLKVVASFFPRPREKLCRAKRLAVSRFFHAVCRTISTFEMVGIASGGETGVGWKIEGGELSKQETSRHRQRGEVFTFFHVYSRMTDSRTFITLAGAAGGAHGRLNGERRSNNARHAER